MDEKPRKNDEQPDDDTVEQKVLDAINQETETPPEEDAPKSGRKSITYTNSPVQVKEALGTIFLGILSLFLLLALLKAHRRERKIRDGLLKKA